MVSNAANDVVINEVDRDACDAKPGRKMTSRVRVVPDGQRCVSLSGKIGCETIDPWQQRSRIEEPVITFIGVHLVLLTMLNHHEGV
jgi:hypothetical protein